MLLLGLASAGVFAISSALWGTQGIPRESYWVKIQTRSVGIRSIIIHLQDIIGYYQLLPIITNYYQLLPVSTGYSQL